MAGIVISVVEKVAAYCVSPIARQIGYIWNYTSNFDNLKKEVQDLEAQRDRVQHQVEAATGNGEEIERQVNIWLERVRTMIAEANGVIQENENANVNCLEGLCPHIKRYQHSRKAAKKGKAVAKLRGEGNFTTVSYRTIPKQIWLPAHKSYEDFQSRKFIFNKILDELSNPEVNTIGIYGTGGIGKTTLARKVAAHTEGDKLFNVVAFAEVTTKPDIKVIQQKIAEELRFSFPKEIETATGRATRLQQRLMQEKTVLLILDNIWDELKLEDVGIPFGDDHKGCKVLLTARSLDVLSKMDSKNIQIDLLDEGEAWSLFKKKAGACIENDVHMQALAIKVAEACGRLPIAITSVAVALKGKGVPVWNDALNELKNPSARSFEGVAAETYTSIEISYKQLKSEELKSIFLLCSIMGDTSIKDLLAYGMGLSMLKGTRTIEEARNRVIALVLQLKDSSLLLDANNEKFLLHDVVRDVARSIASRDGHMIVETGDVIPRELIDKHVLRKCNQISLHAISELPIELECPQLEFFYMKSKKELLKVPDKFFTRMLELKVLHLDGLDLELVSNSLCCLVNLQTLNIISCNLHDFHFIGELKQLKFLAIRSNDFEELPKEMCNLSELRLLDLKKCGNLKDIPPNVLSTLTHLEELYLFNSWGSNIKWEVAGFKLLDELKHLSFLTTLEIRIPNANDLPKGNFLSKKLERYKIYIAYDSWDDYSFDLKKISRVLKLNLENNSCSNDVPHKMSSVEEFLSTLSSEGFSEPEVLCVKNSSRFPTVFDGLKSESWDPFPCLMSLILEQLYKLEKIYDYQLKAESFHQLTTIRVNSCHELKNIFSFSTNRVLPLLQDVTVQYCNNLEEIFAMAREEGQIEFKELRSLSLTSLPKLTNFCRMNSNEVCAPNPIFNQKVALPFLEIIQISHVDDLEMIWPNQLCSNSFCYLKSVELWGCNKLLTIFQSNMLERITRLESLKVMFCYMVQNIFDLQGIDLEESHPQIEIRLQELCIHGLSNLKHIWNKDPQNRLSFQKLKDIEVKECKSMKYLFPISIAKSLLELEKLDVSRCEVEKIVEDEGEAKETATFVFPQITVLSLSDLPKLKTFYQRVHTSQWLNLKELCLGYCPKMELFPSEVFNVQVNNKGQCNSSLQSFMMVQKDPFPKLEKLVIHKDLKLTLQCHLPEQLCCKIKCLEVRQDESVVFPLGMLQRFHNLQELLLYICSYQVLYSYEEAGILDPSVSKCDSKLDTLLHKIESLTLIGCGNLIQLVPSSVSLQNLTSLTVDSCDGLKNLVTSSTAKSLVKLRKMEIVRCNSMIEVVAKEEDETEDNIIFTELRTLTFHRLRSLTCFCSGNYNFELPSLEELHLDKCPQMKYFSLGDVTTPILQKVIINWRLCKLKGDLNTTIQQRQH